MLPRTRPLTSRILTAAKPQNSSWLPSKPVRLLQTSQIARKDKTTPVEPGDKEKLEDFEAQVVASQALPKHNLDYDAVVDYRTSTFSLVPRRVLDGSEPGDSVAAAVVSGAPVDLQARTVRIYKPVKPATQSGTWNPMPWQMDWDPLPKGYRWENPLIGWQSSADFMSGYRVGFNSKEDAIRFAEKQGYEYFVQQPNERRFIAKAYANNFTHSPKKLKMVRTK